MPLKNQGRRWEFEIMRVWILLGTKYYVIRILTFYDPTHPVCNQSLLCNKLSKSYVATKSYGLPPPSWLRNIWMVPYNISLHEWSILFSISTLNTLVGTGCKTHNFEKLRCHMHRTYHIHTNEAPVQKFRNHNSNSRSWGNRTPCGLTSNTMSWAISSELFEVFFAMFHR